jgi:hypothetical protein
MPIYASLYAKRIPFKSTYIHLNAGAKINDVILNLSTVNGKLNDPIFCGILNIFLTPTWNKFTTAAAETNKTLSYYTPARYIRAIIVDNRFNICTAQKAKHVLFLYLCPLLMHLYQTA